MNTKRFYQWMSIITILSMMVGMPQSVRADAMTLYVPDTYATIQEALDVANPGDTIHVRAGTYTGAIAVNKAIRLEGEGSNNTTIDGAGAGVAINVQTNGATLSAFKVVNSNVGVQLTGASNNILDHLWVVGTCGAVCDYGQYDIAFRSGSNYNQVSDTVVSDAYMGIDGGDQSSHHNTFTRIEAYENDHSGISSYAGSDYMVVIDSNLHNNGIGMGIGWSSNWAVSGTTMTGNNVGLGIDTATYGAATNNTITNNTTGVSFGGWGPEHNSITDNIIRGNTTTGLDFTCDARYNTVTGNEISGSGKGVSIRRNDACPNYGNTFHHNTFKNNTIQAQDDEDRYGGNTWDNGYPSGGNTWDTYTGVDLFSGASQDVTGADGIGDTPYVILAGLDVDRYPLMPANQYDPWLEIWYPEDDIQVADWPLNTTVSLVIDNDFDVNNGVLYENTYARGTEERIYIDLSGVFDIGPGQVITVSDAQFTRFHQVTTMTVSGWDLGLDTVFGTADPGSSIRIHAKNSDTDWMWRNVVAGGSGDWVADFSQPGVNPEEQGLLDIKIGTWGAATQSGFLPDDGGQTHYAFYLPNPNLHVFVTQDRIEARDWPNGHVVTLTIENPGTPQSPDYTTTRTMGPAPWNPNEVAAEFDLNGIYHYQVGDLITVSDGTFTKTHTVANVAVTQIDPVAETISGTTDPNVEIEVDIHRGSAPYRRVTADGSGNWTVDFSEPWNDQGTYDLTPNLNGAAMRYDADGDASRADWRVLDPRFHVQLTQNNVEGYDWPLGAPVTITIDTDHNGTPEFTSGPQTVVQENDSTVVRFNSIGGIDLAAGMYITMTNGTILKTHIVTVLTLISVDPATDRLTGTAEPNSYMEVGHLCDQNGCAIRRIYADALGNWVADFSVPGAGTDPDEQRLFDIKPGTGSEVRQPDEDSDHTDIDWRVPNPTFDAWFRDGNINAYDWPLGTLLTLAIEDSTTPLSPDYSTTTTVGVAPWDSTQTLGEFNLNNTFVIQPGMTLSISGASITKELLVLNLTIASIDQNTDIITGGSEPDQQMWMHFDNSSGTCCREFQADGSGVWTVNYSQPGPNGEQVEDIRPGSSGTINARDNDGDNTSLSWHVLNPSIGVRANDNTIEGWDWTLGTTITVTVDDPGTGLSPDITRTTVVYQPDWNPNEHRFDVNLNGEYDIKTGDVVTASDGITTKTHTVTSLAFTDIDIDTDIVTGVAQAGSSVDIWTCDYANCYNYDPDPVADGTGYWSVDFTNIHDIVFGTWIDSAQYDDDGDGTYFGLTVSLPTIEVSPGSHWVHARGNWPDGTLISMTIDDPNTPQPVDYSADATFGQNPGNPGDPNDRLADFDMGNFDLAADQTITMTGGGITKTYTIQPLHVTGFDLDADTISGAGTSGHQLQVCVNNMPGNCSRHITVGSGGNWTADYHNPGARSDEQATTDIHLGSNGWVADYEEDGDQTWVDWTATLGYATVTSINRLDANPTSAASVRFSVKFSEAVTGVDASDFSLATTGITGAAITGVTGSLEDYTVTVNTGTGIGTLRLNLIDNDSIMDGNGDPLAGLYSYNGSFTTGQTYTILSSGGALPRTETLYFNGLQWGSVACWNPYSTNCNNVMAIAQGDNARVTVWETPYVYNMLTGEEFPLLADGPYTWNPARTELTFDIKAAAKWSDGTPVTAYDVAYTWATNVKYGTNAGTGYQDYIDTIEAVNSQTVRVKAKLDGNGKAINPLMVSSYLSANYVIQKAWTQTLEERAGYDATALLNDSGEDFIASGPYTKFLADDTKVVLMRDDNYWGKDVSMWGKLPAPKYLAHVIYADDAAGLNAFKAGQVDVSQQFIANVQDLWLVDHLPISTYLPDAPYGIGASLPTAFYNLNSYGLDQVAVRKAIAIAIDYDTIIANAITNQSPTFTQIPRSIMNPTPGEQALYDHAAVAGLQWAGNDIAGAKALLDAAGIIDTNGDGWREYNGQKLSYVATCPNGWTDWQAAIEIVAAGGRAIGIDVTTNYPEWSEYQTVVTRSDVPLAAGYDIFMMWSDGAGPTEPWGRARHLMSSEFIGLGSNWNGNWGQYSNPDVDALIQAIPGETDPIQLMADYTELTRIYLTDIPSFTLMYRPQSFHTVNESVWTNFPHEGDGTNPPIPPLDLTDGYSIAGLYNLEQLNLAPVAVDDNYDATKNTVLNVPAATGVLANDTDADALTAVKLTDPAHGALTFNSDGSFTYTPQAGYTGNDTFTYQASDGILTSNIATVTIKVSSGGPPAMPSSFYGEIHFSDGAPNIGDVVQAYLPGGSLPAATALIGDYQGTLIYGMDVPGEAANEGDVVTFKINGRVVATGEWHSGTNVRVDFHPPQALPGGPYSGDEGTEIVFIGSATDWGGDASTYLWDWDNDGTYDINSPTPGHTWYQDGIYTVGLKVTDARGGEGTVTFTVTVNNVLPVVDAGGPYTANEGSALTLTGTAPDPGSEPLTIEWDFDYDGVTFGVDASGSLSASHTYDNNGTYTAALRVTDDHDSVIDTAAVTIQNVAPTATLTNNSPVNEGSPATISFNGQSDPSNADTTAGFHYAYACDGSSLASATYANSGTNASTTCTFDDGSLLTIVRARIIDQDNGYTEYTTDVIVDNVQPTATFNTPTSVDEGGEVVLSLTGPFDPSVADTTAGFWYAFDCGTGYGAWSTTVTTVTCPTTDNGLLTVSGKIRDKDFAQAEYIVDVTVNDVLPTNVSAGGPYTVIAGQQLTLTGSATCASVDACLFEWDLDNDLAYDDATGTSAVRSWNTAGDYTIGIRVTDNDGNAVTAAGLVHVSGATHSITLVSGWNLVSFNVHPTDTNIASVLSSVAGNFDLVYAWDATGAHPSSGNWLKYDNILFTLDSLTTLDEKMGFWIHMTSADVLDVTGSIPTTTTLSLSDNVGGWNLVGFSSAVGQNLPAVLEAHGVGTDYTLIYAYHASDLTDPWKLYDRSGFPFLNDLQQLTPGWGYWIKVTADHDWEVVYMP